MPGCWISPRWIGLLGAALSAIGAAGPVQADPTLAVITACGRPLPAYFVNGADVPVMFGVDAGGFARELAGAYPRDIALLCDASPKVQGAVAAKIARVCFVAAAGADDPYPYVAGRILVIETRPGPYDGKTFRRDLARAIERGPVVASSEECEASGG